MPRVRQNAKPSTGQERRQRWVIQSTRADRTFPVPRGLGSAHGRRGHQVQDGNGSTSARQVTSSDYVLFCLKPIYGLNELCLRGHFEEQGGRASLLDENMFFWKDGKGVKSMITTHVDDISAAGANKWLKKQHEVLVSKFGKVSRQGLPFVHCGIEYSRAPDVYFLSQDSFASELKQVHVPAHRPSYGSRPLGWTSLLMSVRYSHR